MAARCHSATIWARGTRWTSCAADGGHGARHLPLSPHYAVGDGLQGSTIVTLRCPYLTLRGQRSWHWSLGAAISLGPISSFGVLPRDFHFRLVVFLFPRHSGVARDGGSHARWAGIPSTVGFCFCVFFFLDVTRLGHAS